MMMGRIVARRTLAAAQARIEAQRLHDELEAAHLLELDVQSMAAAAPVAVRAFALARHASTAVAAAVAVAVGREMAMLTRAPRTTASTVLLLLLLSIPIRFVTCRQIVFNVLLLLLHHIAIAIAVILIPIPVRIRAGHHEQLRPDVLGLLGADVRLERRIGVHDVQTVAGAVHAVQHQPEIGGRMTTPAAHGPGHRNLDPLVMVGGVLRTGVACRCQFEATFAQQMAMAGRLQQLIDGQTVRGCTSRRFSLPRTMGAHHQLQLRVLDVRRQGAGVMGQAKVHVHAIGGGGRRAVGGVIGVDGRAEGSPDAQPMGDEVVVVTGVWSGENADG